MTGESKDRNAGRVPQSIDGLPLPTRLSLLACTTSVGLALCQLSLTRLLDRQPDVRSHASDASPARFLPLPAILWLTAPPSRVAPFGPDIDHTPLPSRRHLRYS